MTMLPAFCRTHGLFGFNPPFAGFSSLTIERSSTECPHCGLQCEILSGTYTEAAEGMQLLLNGKNSAETLRALRELAELTRRGEISPQEARSRAEKIAPQAARLFDVANWSDQAKATLYASIIGAAAVIAAARIASTPTQVVHVNSPTEVTASITKQRLKSSTSWTIPLNPPMPKPRPKGRR